MFNDLSSPATLLATRRSGKPRDMIAPGPDDAQMRRILGAAMRVPDHGKLAPWRFVVIAQDQRGDLAALLERAYRIDRREPGRLELDAVRQFATQAPALVVVLSWPHAGSHIPLWEQQLSAGAACMNLAVAAHAEGFVSGWLTGWAAYSRTVLEGIAGADAPADARIAGFMFLGTAGNTLEERPRPDPAQVAGAWMPIARSQ